MSEKKLVPRVLEVCGLEEDPERLRAFAAEHAAEAATTEAYDFGFVEDF
jgi:hypothetical protein